MLLGIWSDSHLVLWDYLIALRACRHRALDSRARQPTDRQPTNQKTSKARSQQTNKPTNQQGQNPSKIAPEGSQKVNFFDWFWGRVLVAFGPNLAPTWFQKPSQNGAKLFQKSIKSCIKILMNFLIDFWWLWERVLVDFASKLEGRGTQKL